MTLDHGSGPPLAKSHWTRIVAGWLIAPTRVVAYRPAISQTAVLPMSSIRPLVPLLIAAGILLGGNGMQGTLIALRGAQEGFSPALIGFIGTAYFGGFLIGCIAITRIMKAVGHVRAFAALAAIASAGTLLLVLVIDPIMWSAVRFAGGFCFAGLFTIMESWLNSGVANRDRARVLAFYRIIDISSVTGAQFMIPVYRHPGLRYLRDDVDHDHLVAGAGVARRPLQSGAAGGGQARLGASLADLAARLDRLHRRRPHQQRVPHPVARSMPRRSACRSPMWLRLSASASSVGR